MGPERQVEIKLCPNDEAKILNIWADIEHKEMFYQRIRAIAAKLTQAHLLGEQGDARETDEYLSAVIEFILTAWDSLYPIFYCADVIADAGNPEFINPANNLPNDMTGTNFRIALSRLLCDCSASMLDDVGFTLGRDGETQLS